MTIQYEQFLESKRITSRPTGFEVNDDDLSPMLFPFQLDITKWALRRGRAAIWADCGLGKTPCQLEFAKHVSQRTDGPVIIFAPLAVSKQTQREGEKFGIHVTVCESQIDVKDGVNITNYEKIHHFDCNKFTGIVLDESSILKGFDGKTRRLLTDFAKPIAYRLACTATPAPNDLIELTNHSEFLDLMSGKEIIALFFTQDGNSSSKFRLKGHAREAFWKWLASWAVALRKPSDLGYDDGDFVLPELRVHEISVDSKPLDGYLFPIDASTMSERREARRSSLSDKVQVCADLINGNKEPWLIWCDLNVESESLKKAISGSVEVKGSDSISHKESSMFNFSNMNISTLVSKPSICGWGMNWQHCSKMAFVGLSDSFESMYQAIRRCWRFGQKNPVDVYIITSESEGAVLANVRRKERDASEMMDQVVSHMKGLSLGHAVRDEMVYQERIEKGDGWEMRLGDCVTEIDKIADNSVGLCVHSPPFPGLYVYSNSSHDIGNTKNHQEMLDHYRFLVGRDKLFRVLMPGRTCAIHLCQTPIHKGIEGHTGLRDFRGDVIRLMQSEGWIYYGEVCIDKDPQVKAVRTKDSSLQFKSLANDSSRMRMAIADYMLQFRKPGDNPNPIRAGISKKYKNENGWITNDEWIRWARPVWYAGDLVGDDGIYETDVLKNYKLGRENDDEKHLCPLQLSVIERAIKLWSAPGEIVLDPFGGIGSTGYQAIKFGRKCILIELKESYWKIAVTNLRRAEKEASQQTLFPLDCPSDDGDSESDLDDSDSDPVVEEMYDV